MISVVILNWKRPDNIINDILPKIVNYKLVSEVIISHGNSKTYFETPHATQIKRLQNIPCILQRKFKQVLSKGWSRQGKPHHQTPTH